MTCREIDSGVFIRIQSNNLPNYCARLVEDGSTTQIDPVPRNWGIDYEVEFNSKVSMDDAIIDEPYIRNPTTTTDLLCTNRKYIDYDYKNPNIDTIYGRTFSGWTRLPLDMIGVLNNGVVQMQALTDEGLDPWNPIDSDDSETGKIDVCGTEVAEYYTYGQDMDSEDKDNYLHSKILPGCIYKLQNDGTRTTVDKCSGSCVDDVIDYMRVSGDFKYIYTGLQIIGIALDGHAIFGPYNDEHELWTCEDHDVCNGHWFSEMDDTYAYITTSTHPYMVGCWGPGPV